jgi:hypothetical protein
MLILASVEPTEWFQMGGNARVELSKTHKMQQMFVVCDGHFPKSPFLSGH